MKRKIILLTVIVLLIGCKNKNEMNYKNPNLPIEERVKDLLKQMTLDEKVAQMVSVNTEVKDLIVFNSDGSFDIELVKIALPNGIGQITRPSETRGGSSQTSTQDAKPLTPYENAVLTNTIQKYFIEQTRLGIPVIFHEECLHGLAAAHATSFPQPIALAGTFNPELLKEVYRMIAKETRLRGGHQALTPVVDVARDPRWGRVEETFGEDTYLVTQMGKAAVNGFQGDGSFSDNEHVLATLKHFVGHGEPVGGTNTAPANYSERYLREVHLRPFKDLIQNEGVMSLMASYNEVDGVPSHANKWLLNDLLRKEYGFKGFVVGDYYAIREMHQRDGITAHQIANDGKHAAELAINAGVNIELPEPDCYKHIIELLDEGRIEEARIDELVGEMLAVKFKLGLFDNPYVDPKKAEEFCGTEENRELALKAALQSITLLKNKNNCVPISTAKNQSIAVIGPNADRNLLGGYSGTPNYYVSVLEGLKNELGSDCNITYAKGCDITIGGSWVQDEIVLPNAEENQRNIEEAVRTAKKADVIVLAIGGNEQTSREAWSIAHEGDRSDLELFGDQNKLIDALHATGKPIVALVFNGRPLAFNNLVEKADAIFECWYLGQETGVAVSKVLSGEYNPGGKLPISFPRSVGHLPVYYSHKPTARRAYLKDSVSALFPFGFGLSYTSFECSNLRIAKSEMMANESTKVWVDVKNTGERVGDEVVQLYIRDEISSVTRPVKELKDFERITLKPGESKTVELDITPDKLKFYDINMDYIVEPGEFSIMVGSSSMYSDLQTTQLTVLK
jgi:beta-glucosidase